jgi:hypothetical protein
VREDSVVALTQSGLRYRIGLEEAAAPDLAALAVSGVRAATVDSHIELEADTLDALNLFLDRLRGSGHLIAEVVPLHSDLEDVFIEAVAGDDRTAPAPASHHEPGDRRRRGEAER